MEEKTLLTVPPIEPNKFTKLLELIKQICDICRIGNMAIHDRKDIFFILIAILIGIILLVAGFKNEGLWTLLGVVIVSLIRAIVHTWHYELRAGLREKKEK